MIPVFPAVKPYGYSLLTKLAPHLTPTAYAQHCRWMEQALAWARQAGRAGDVPVGAVVVNSSGQVLGEAGNRKHQDQDPTAHAEVLALRQASRALGTWHLGHCTLYVTLEPCILCTGAILQARLGLLVYGAWDQKTGAIHSVFNLPASQGSNHPLLAIAGIQADQCGALLQTWFAEKRLAP